jgi:hypothetical protein
MNANNADISEEKQSDLAPDGLKQAAQRELAAGVLKQTAQDLRQFHEATSKIERELYLDAYRWITAGQCSSPFSFMNVCQLLNLAPEVVRQELHEELSLGAFRYRIRRCGRLVARLHISLSQLFTNEHNPGARFAS